MAQNFASFTIAERRTNPSVLEMLNNAFATINPDVVRPGGFTIDPGIFTGGLVATPGAVAAPTTPGTSTVLPRVRPGDVITADMMNMVLEMLETLAAGLATQSAMFGPDVAALRLGNLAEDTHTPVSYTHLTLPTNREV